MLVTVVNAPLKADLVQAALMLNYNKRAVG